jgi:hypothetical protein
MDLDQLKLIWNDADKSSSQTNEPDLQMMIKHRSKLPIAIMKRNLRLEVYFLILAYGIIIWLISNEYGTKYILYDIGLIAVALVFFAYARFKYKILDNMQCMSCEVKSNLNHQLKSLEKLVKLYFHTGNIAVILVYLITGTISYIKSADETASIPQWIEILIFLFIGAVLGVMNYYFGRWYLFNLYGKHIQNLKNILYEMDESDTK